MQLCSSPGGTEFAKWINIDKWLTDYAAKYTQEDHNLNQGVVGMSHNQVGHRMKAQALDQDHSKAPVEEVQPMRSRRAHADRQTEAKEEIPMLQLWKIWAYLPRL